LSVADQVTIVVPTGNAAGALLVIEATVQLSNAIAVPIFNPVAVQEVFELELIFCGAITIGAITSVMVTF